MARIRSIKPGFFRHEGLYESERETGLPLRLAFAGLWTAADREGRFVWSARNLKLDALPYDDDVDFARVLDALWARGSIKKYVVDGKEYGFIPSWSEHQVINNREAPSNLPEPNENNTLTREPREDDACATPLKSAQAEGKGREGKGKGMDRGTRETRPSRFDEFWKEYPKRDGSNPKEPSRKLFDAAVRRGVTPETIIGAAARYGAECRRLSIERTDKVAQALTWLRQQRWQDYPEGTIDSGGDEGRWARMLQTERERGHWPFEKAPKAEIPAEFIERWEKLNPPTQIIQFPGATT